jgi:hypothetical protein
MKKLSSLIYVIFCVATGMVGYNINVAAASSCPLFWSIVDWAFTPIAIVKWLICQQLNMSVIKHTFAFFFN